MSIRLEDMSFVIASPLPNPITPIRWPANDIVTFFVIARALLSEGKSLYRAIQAVEDQMPKVAKKLAEHEEYIPACKQILFHAIRAIPLICKQRIPQETRKQLMFVRHASKSKFDHYVKKNL